MIDVLARLDNAGDVLVSTGREDLHELADDLADVRKAVAELMSAYQDRIDSLYGLARAKYDGAPVTLHAEDCARAEVRMDKAFTNAGGYQ